jgi:hypothetical protein
MAENVDRSKAVELPVRANCELVRRDEGGLEFRFPEKDGLLTSARWDFQDRSELVDHLAQLLSLDPAAGGLRGTAVCRGKYERRDADGNRAFTFGDPILDLITSPDGTLIVGGLRTDVAALELSSARQRTGGIRSIDLTVISQAMWDLQTAQAAMGQGDHALVECNRDVVALASTNPSKRDFRWNGTSDLLRFKAWRKSYPFYWSMGAEIETWGHDFDSARIESRYLDIIAGAVCAAVKVDSDSDTDDDYVDEYEWGVNAPQPLRVVSNCTADWHGERFGGQVAAGQECFEI